MAGSSRKTGTTDQRGPTALVISQELKAALERHGAGIPKTGIPTSEPGRNDEPVLGAATIDHLLTHHSANSLLEELDSLELQAEQWRAAIVRLRSAILTYSADEAGRPQARASHLWNDRSPRTTSAALCEADDAHWYL